MQDFDGIRYSMRGTLAKHAVFDPGQLLLNNAGSRLGGKQLQRHAITQGAFGFAQPSRGIRGLSSEDLLGPGRNARDPHIVTYFSCSHQIQSLFLLGDEGRIGSPQHSTRASLTMIPQTSKA